MRRSATRAGEVKVDKWYIIIIIIMIDTCMWWASSLLASGTSGRSEACGLARWAKARQWPPHYSIPVAKARGIPSSAYLYTLQFGPLQPVLHFLRHLRLTGNSRRGQPSRSGVRILNSSEFPAILPQNLRRGQGMRYRGSQPSDQTCHMM